MYFMNLGVRTGRQLSVHFGKQMKYRWVNIIGVMKTGRKGPDVKFNIPMLLPSKLRRSEFTANVYFTLLYIFTPKFKKYILPPL